MAPGTEGGVTKHIPSGEVMSIFDAAEKYAAQDKDLVVFAGSLYGNGSSRDWAAKGTILLGVKAVIASSFERIHRSNLIGMGVLPLEFQEGDSWQKLGLKGPYLSHHQLTQKTKAALEKSRLLWFETGRMSEPCFDILPSNS